MYHILRNSFFQLFPLKINLDGDEMKEMLALTEDLKKKRLYRQLKKTICTYSTEKDISPLIIKETISEGNKRGKKICAHFKIFVNG